MYAQSGRPALPLALGNGNVSIIFITIDIDNPIFDDFRKKIGTGSSIHSNLTPPRFDFHTREHDKI